MPSWSKLPPNLLVPSSWSGLSTLNELMALIILPSFSPVSWGADCPRKEERMTPVQLKPHHHHEPAGDLPELPSISLPAELML